MNNVKRIITLGFFDGVHIGHLKLLGLAKEMALRHNAITSVYTFDKQPLSFIMNKRESLIIPSHMRRDSIQKFGNVDEVIYKEFDEELINTSWDDFIKYELVGKYNTVGIVCGRNHKFGRGGEGNFEKLSQICGDMGIELKVLDDVIIDDVKVSSTYIRELISSGNISLANKMLTRPFFINGVVQKGRQLGRTIGVPTINIPINCNIKGPSNGVYCTVVNIDDKKYISATNVGVCPTISNSGEKKLEAHLFNFAGDLYGREVTVDFYEFIRHEEKFDGLEELKLKIKDDIKEVVAYFGARLGDVL